MFALIVASSTGASAQDAGVLPNAAAPLTIPTPDGSGQVTEPSIVKFSPPWRGFTYWMVVAPYPHSDAEDENPSIFVSDDGQQWSLPPGGTNPIQKPTPHSHLADSSLFYDRISDQLWLYYISEDQFHFTDVIRTISIDGLHWSTPERVIHAPDYQVVMPTVAKIGDQYWLWSVNAGGAGCSASSTFVQYRTSWDGVHWSAPRLTDIVQPGYRIWHIGVTELFELRPRISMPVRRDRFVNDGSIRRDFDDDVQTEDQLVFTRGVYAMLASAYDSDCGHDDLFLALSDDGIHWTHFSRPLLTPDRGHWDGSAIYKSTLAFDSKTDVITVWYSALAGDSWHLGVTQGDLRHTLQELRVPDRRPF